MSEDAVKPRLSLPLYGAVESVRFIRVAGWKHQLGTGVMNTVVPLSAKEVLTTDFNGQVALVASE